MQNLHHLFTHYTLCFRCLPRQRTLRNSSESSKIHSIHPQTLRIMRILHKNSSTSISLFSEPSTENSRKLERINQILRNSPTAPTNYAKFTESTPMDSNQGVNPENSRKIQRTTQILCQSHNTSANHVKFATFAHNRQDKLHISYTFCTYFTTCISHVCTHLAPL